MSKKYKVSELDRIDEEVFVARIAEKSKRFEDMLERMEYVVKVKGTDLNIGERNLFLMAAKGLIGSERNALR